MSEEPRKQSGIEMIMKKLEAIENYIDDMDKRNFTIFTELCSKIDALGVIIYSMNNQGKKSSTEFTDADLNETIKAYSKPKNIENKESGEEFTESN